MTWQITDAVVGSQPIASFDTVQKHPFGTIVRAKDPDYGEGEFIYLKGVASTLVGDWVLYKEDDWTTERLVADSIGPVAIAMSANILATTYGWYQIRGKAVGSCLTAFADNAQVWITATAGAIDDVSVTGDLVNLAKGASTVSGATILADFEINRPFVNDFSNAA